MDFYASATQKDTGIKKKFRADIDQGPKHHFSVISNDTSFEERLASAIKKNSVLDEDFNSAVAEFEANNSQLAGHHWGNESVGGVGYLHTGLSKGDVTGYYSLLDADLSDSQGSVASFEFEESYDSKHSKKEHIKLKKVIPPKERRSKKFLE